MFLRSFKDIFLTQLALQVLCYLQLITATNNQLPLITSVFRKRFVLYCIAKWIEQLPGYECGAALQHTVKRTVSCEAGPHRSLIRPLKQTAIETKHRGDSWTSFPGRSSCELISVLKLYFHVCTCFNKSRLLFIILQQNVKKSEVV